MGKGDRKTRKGKISMGTYGNLRPRKVKNLTVGHASPSEEKVKPKAKPKRKTKKSE